MVTVPRIETGIPEHEAGMTVIRSWRSDFQVIHLAVYIHNVLYSECTVATIPN
jgi:hypothetical protein